jgi:hypothetical protein
MIGGAVWICEPLYQLEPQRQELIKKLVPSYPLSCRPIDLFDSVRLFTGDYPSVPEKSLSDANDNAEPASCNPPRIWHAEVKKDFGNWQLLAIYNWSLETPIQLTIEMEELGLSDDQEFLVFDRWEDKFRGTATGQIIVDVAVSSVKLLALYPDNNKPQVIGTDYHITGGGPDLVDVKWDEKACSLKGKSEAVAGEKYGIFIYVPKGYALQDGTSGSVCSKIDFVIGEEGTLDWAIPVEKINP